MRTATLVGLVCLAMMGGIVVGSRARHGNEEKRVAPLRAVCEVHGLEMRRVRVPLVTGLPDARWRDDPGMRRAERFPHSALRVFGGCRLEGKEPKTVGVFHCPACIRGAFAWEAAHRVKRGRPPPVAPPAHRAIGREVAKGLALGVR